MSPKQVTLRGYLQLHRSYTGELDAFDTHDYTAEVLICDYCTSKWITRLPGCLDVHFS